MRRTRSRLGKEILIAVLLLSFSLLLLPALVYWGGVRVVGEYSAEGGLADLTWHIWSDLMAGNAPAWVLVVSPFLIIQFLRFAHALWRH